ncbi:uncharacterized protein [Temnothorax longispinosus]|uniref:uncharacterized protein n=1 Tax=Temnothorax longispinosus TaxID=300112 RepID=UPI003A995FAB
MEKPTNMHWQGVKRVFRFKKKTANRGIAFDPNSNCTELNVYCDADWAVDIDTRRSTTGWIALLNGGPVAWSSRKQTVTATSTTEAEFVALCATTKAVIWLKRLMSNLDQQQTQPKPIRCDNQRAITLMRKREGP